MMGGNPIFAWDLRPGKAQIRLLNNRDWLEFNGVASTLQKYAHRRETTGTSIDSLQLRLFSN